MKDVLVACVGNVFLGDDGFGVEVARRLAREALPERTRVVDFGIRGLHLAYDLLSRPDLLVLVDATSRGGPPGTLYVLELDGLDDAHAAESAHAAEDAPAAENTPRSNAHAMDPRTVFATVRHMGGSLPRTRIVGCEPADFGRGMSLSDPVREAIEPAIAMIRQLIQDEVRP